MSADHNLLTRSANGQGVNQNISLGKEYFKKACSNGFEASCDAYRQIVKAGF